MIFFCSWWRIKKRRFIDDMGHIEAEGDFVGLSIEIPDIH
jgi:hypothetical protein